MAEISLNRGHLDYSFEFNDNCEMCGTGLSNAIILGQRLNTTQGRSPKKKIGISVTVMKCRNCGLIFSQPMPIPSDFQQHYGVTPEDFWKEHYFNWQPSYFSAEISVAGKLLGNLEGKRALDIGFGIGKCMKSLTMAGFDTYGCEPSEQFYKRTVSQMQVDSSKLKLGMIETVEYPAGFFDFITFGAVFEHLYHPATCLQRALHWVKPGGIIHIEVPSARYLISSVYNLFYRLRGTNYVTNLSPMHVPFHLYEFTLKSFQELGKRLGFQIEHHEFNVCEIMHLPSVVKPLLRKYMEWTNRGMQLTVYIRKINS